MNELKGKKFVASYSSGKDSTLSIYKAIQSGMIPMALIMTYNTDRERSWFHGISSQVIQKLETSMNLPITLIKTSGEDYEKTSKKNSCLKNQPEQKSASSATSTWKNTWPGAAPAAKTPAFSHPSHSGRKAADKPSWNS